MAGEGLVTINTSELDGFSEHVIKQIERDARRTSLIINAGQPDALAVRQGMTRFGKKHGLRMRQIAARNAPTDEQYRLGKAKAYSMAVYGGGGKHYPSKTPLLSMKAGPTRKARGKIIIGRKTKAQMKANRISVWTNTGTKTRRGKATEKAAKAEQASRRTAGGGISGWDPSIRKFTSKGKIRPIKWLYKAGEQLVPMVGIGMARETEQVLDELFARYAKSVEGKQVSGPQVAAGTSRTIADKAFTSQGGTIGTWWNNSQWAGAQAASSASRAATAAERIRARNQATANLQSQGYYPRGYNSPTKR